MTVANAVTGVRLIFFALFLWAAAAHQIGLAIFFWLLAWALDFVDGWLARRLRQATAFGYIFDKAVDRLVLFGGVLVVLTEQLVPDYALLLLTKEIAILPALSWQMHQRAAMPSLGLFGKILNILQGLGFIWLLLGLPGGLWITLTIAVLGGGAGYWYLRQTIAGR